MDPVFFADSDEARRWFADNCDSADEIWVGLYKKGASRSGIKMQEALDQALCFGWIDTKGMRIDDERWMVRFVPRGPNSNWSERNVARVEELKADGLMAEPGLQAFERRDAG